MEPTKKTELTLEDRVLALEAISGVQARLIEVLTSALNDYLRAIAPKPNI